MSDCRGSPITLFPPKVVLVAPALGLAQITVLRLAFALGHRKVGLAFGIKLLVTTIIARFTTYHIVRLVDPQPTRPVIPLGVLLDRPLLGKETNGGPHD